MIILSGYKCYIIFYIDVYMAMQNMIQKYDAKY
jgi:hypothetical protein